MLYAKPEARTPQSQAWFKQNEDVLVTTDYVVDELLTLLRSRGRARRAIEAGFDLWDERYARIEFLTQTDIAAAWDVFRQFDDKKWSFTDCTSYVVMKRLGINTAFTFDIHFRQFQTVNVVP